MVGRLLTAAAVLLFVLLIGQGSAWATCTVPTSFSNNTVADADQVNGNFTAVLACINASLVSGTPGSVQGAPANPSATSSGTLVMMGMGGTCAITPNRSGKVLFVISGDVQNTTANSGSLYQIRYGTGTAPSNAAALTGTAASAQGGPNIPNASGNAVPFSTQGTVTGLTVGVLYWFDLSLASIVSGPSSITNISCSALES